jgi:molecular chaperone DnaJ
VQTPQHLTRRQRGWLEEFDAESKSHAKGSPETEGFFAKVREFFDGSRS